MMPHFERTWKILFDVINKYGDLEIYCFFVSARQKVIWLGFSGLTLNLMSWACKGYMSTSEIKTFDSYVKQEVLNDEKNVKNIKFDTRLCHGLSFHYDVKMVFFHFLTFQWTEASGQVIFLRQEWHKHSNHFKTSSLDSVTTYI